MTKSQIQKMPPWFWSGLLFVGGVVIGLGGKALGFAHEPLGAGLLSAVICISSIPLIFAYWGRLDEVAREAHKFAWYWGGTAGLLAMVVAFTVLMAPGGDLVGLGFLGADKPKTLFAFGMLGTVLAQVIGYALAWAGWWIARR